MSRSQWEWGWGWVVGGKLGLDPEGEEQCGSFGALALPEPSLWQKGHCWDLLALVLALES